jgi:hypothetical protein
MCAPLIRPQRAEARHNHPRWQRSIARGIAGAMRTAVAPHAVIPRAPAPRRHQNVIRSASMGGLSWMNSVPAAPMPTE